MFLGTSFSNIRRARDFTESTNDTTRHSWPENTFCKFCCPCPAFFQKAWGPTHSTSMSTQSKTCLQRFACNMAPMYDCRYIAATNLRKATTVFCKWWTLLNWTWYYWFSSYSVSFKNIGTLLRPIHSEGFRKIALNLKNSQGRADLFFLLL